MEQFKSLSDLRDAIKEIEGWIARPTTHLSHPTLYRKRDVDESEILLKGVRKKDWFFSDDEKWVLPHDQMGLSFSSSWQHLKGVFKLKEKNNSGKKVNVYWVLEKADIPSDLEFVIDRKKKGHFFLTVTKRMTLSQLVIKLKLVAKRMSVIENVGSIL